MKTTCKRYASITLIIIMFAFVLCACSKKTAGNGTTTADSDGKSDMAATTTQAAVTEAATKETVNNETTTQEPETEAATDKETTAEATSAKETETESEETSTEPVTEETTEEVTTEEVTTEEVTTEPETEPPLVINYSGDVTSYLIIGSDIRHPGQENKLRGNSDVMIIASFNTRTRQIVLTSIMRDTYAYIDYPETDSLNVDGSDKINAAMPRGGPDLLIQTIYDNFKVPIEGYFCVDFYEVADILDVVYDGEGYEATFATAEEVNNINWYIKGIDMVRMGTEDEQYWASPNEFGEPGTYRLNGVQTVGYCRDRYTSGGDYARTEKQRNVVIYCLSRLRNLDFWRISELAAVIVPRVATNLSFEAVMNIVSNANEYLSYDIVSQRVPFDGMFSSEPAQTKFGVQGVLIPNYRDTAIKLKQVIDPE